MEPPKGFADRVEKWLSYIPGIRTYQDREHRRETDKRMREHLSSRLQEPRSVLRRLALDLSQRGRLEGLAELDRFSSHLQQIADTILHASYGFAGIFDLKKIREEELDRLYAFDLSLLEEIEGLRATVQAWGADPSPEVLKGRILEAERRLDGLEAKFRQRSDFLSRPAAAGNAERRKP